MDRREMLSAGAGFAAWAGLGGPVAARAGDTGGDAGADIGLRALADAKRMRLGSAIDLADVSRPDMVALFARHCNSLTPRNALKWQVTHRAENVFDFHGADGIVRFARGAGYGVYGHTLIWYRVPRWVEVIDTAPALLAAMRNHIQTTVRRYAGQIYAWDVVNEPMEYSAPALRNSVFQRILGEDHIRAAFDMAREADPAALLVLNETHLEKAGDMYDQRRALFLGLVERLRAKGAPIGAVGLQAHFRPGLDALDETALASLCASLKGMGVNVFITELDASCRFIKRVPGFTGAEYGEVFRDVIATAGRAGTLKGVTLWGIAEQYAPRETKEGNICRARVNLYDDDMAPRSTIAGLAAGIRGLK